MSLPGRWLPLCLALFGGAAQPLAAADDDPFRIAYQTAMSRQRPVTVESFDDQRQRWYQNRVYPSGEGLTVIFIDVTDRKLAELREIAQNRILEGIAAHRSLTASLTEIAHLHERLNPDTLCSLLLVSPDGKRVVHGAAPSLPPEFTSAVDGLEVGEGRGSCGTAVARAEQVIVSDIATHPYWDSYRHLALPHGLHACWSTPVMGSTGEVLGTFAVYHRQRMIERRLEAFLSGASTRCCRSPRSRSRATG